MSCLRIALVEDNRQFLDELRVLLAEASQLEVVGTFTTGEDALHGVMSVRPDVTLVDIGLPGISGVEVVRRLAERACTTECLMLTAFDDDAHLFAALAAGAVGYIVKDEASLPTLVRAIEEAKNGGAPMSFGIARRVLESFRHRAPHAPELPTEDLTAREREVLEYRVQGFSTKKVAQVLHISYETVRRHQKAIYEKLHVHSMVEAIAAVNNTQESRRR